METNNSDDLYKEELLNIGKIKKVCKRNTFLNLLPIVKWLPNYSINDFFPDLVAGLTVGLTAIPQGIAYGVVAGLGPEYGLYSSFMGCFIYILFGSCKDITVGPTAIMALMVEKYVKLSPDYAILLAFIAGFIILICGLLKLGFLVQFISIPVTAGFTTAAAITIGSGQINALFGIKSSSNEFVHAWSNFFTKFPTLNLYDALLGIITLIFLLVLRKFKDINGKFKPFFKYLSLSRNALAVIFGIIIAYLLDNNGTNPFRLTGNIKPGLPEPRLPPFTSNMNGTKIEFVEMIGTLGSSIIAIPLVAILESVAIAKAFSKGKTIDASQEMIALGLCNIFGSFFQSMPTTGSFTRTAVNNNSGVRTTLGGVYTGIIVLLALALLTQTFYFIPKATLAAIIVGAMIFMIEYDKAIEIWKSKKIDIIPFTVTLITCLFLGLEIGMVIGIIINISFILYKSARPNIKIEKNKMNDTEYIVIRLNENLLFSSAEYIKYKIVKYVLQNKCKYVIINGDDILSTDSSSAMNILSLKNDLKTLDCELIFWNWNKNTAGVLYRLDSSIKNLLKFGSNSNIVIREHTSDKYNESNNIV